MLGTLIRQILSVGVPGSEIEPSRAAASEWPRQISVLTVSRVLSTGAHVARGMH